MATMAPERKPEPLQPDRPSAPRGLGGPGREAGFTLLEALVAVVLIGLVIIPLYALQNTNLVGLFRIEDTNRRVEAERSALALVEAVNPMATPEGAVELGEMQVAWTSRPLTAVVDNRDYPDGVGIYQVALYEMDVRISREGDDAWHRFTVKQIGYKQVRSPVGGIGLIGN